MPCGDPMPIPAEHIDVHRITATSLDTADEKQIDEIWDGAVGTRRSLSDLWIDEMRFLKFGRRRPALKSSVVD